MLLYSVYHILLTSTFITPRPPPPQAAKQLGVHRPAAHPAGRRGQDRPQPHPQSGEGDPLHAEVSEADARDGLRVGQERGPG